MPQSNNVRYYDKDLLKTIVVSQQGIDVNYDPKTVFGGYARVVEDQSAAFLEDYLNGEISLEPGTEELMHSFFASLKKSKYRRIAKLVQKAEDKFKQTAIQQFKETEKAKAFKDTRFKILNSKKEAAHLSSKDMLLIASLLKEDLGYSTAKLQDKLRSFAMEKIRKTLAGEIPQDADFEKLAEGFGTYQQKQAVHAKLHPQPSQKKEVIDETPFSARIVSLDNSKPLKPSKTETQSPKTAAKSPKTTASAPEKKNPVDNKKQIKQKKEKKSRGLFAKAWKWTKRTAIVAGLAALGFLGGHLIKSQFGNSADTSNKENKAKTEVQVKTPAKEKQTVDKTKTADFSKEMTALEKAYKNRFDTSLEIILGAQKRDKLYQQIDKLAQAGKIQYKDGTTREWYAHAFTMYDQLAPYSKENKVIKSLLSGHDVDKDYINSLVVKSGRNGKGIEASGKYSSFDKASKTLQQKHIKNRKAVKMAEKAAQMAKSQQSR